VGGVLEGLQLRLRLWGLLDEGTAGEPARLGHGAIRGHANDLEVFDRRSAARGDGHELVDTTLDFDHVVGADVMAITGTEKEGLVVFSTAVVAATGAVPGDDHGNGAWVKWLGVCIGDGHVFLLWCFVGWLVQATA
jgi:hypothetical protein